MLVPSFQFIYFYIAGEYLVSIKFNDEHIPESPFRVPISPSIGEAKKLSVSALQNKGLQVCCLNLRFLFHTNSDKETYEPWNDKTNKMSVHLAKTQISLGIRPVWSEFSLSAWRNLGSLATHWVHSEDWSDWVDAQSDLSLRWVHTHFVGFVMLRLIPAVTDHFNVEWVLWFYVPLTS